MNRMNGYPQGGWGHFTVASILEGWTWGSGFTGMEASHGMIMRCLERYFGKE